MSSTLTIKGQTTIPKAIRDHLQLRAGDRLKYFLQPDGSVALLPKRPAAALRAGAEPWRGAPVTLGAMDEAVAAGAADLARAPPRG